ncbi:MAG: hypothetical protein KGH61_00325 [Candidatus Micrarchaeota archaeon]|nr:hypothetical protein [Candidatus Micrarchaeota archaeon]MDE1847382.1 hypothetical protein [Candidatus Micrarchaeota archaeon]MDE1863997.1 hypothetical protein [Candidatus Micrarchaeota archaeon]
MVDIPKNERTIFMLEVAVIVLSFVAAALFVYLRGSLIFYGMAAAVFVIAFYAIFLMSKLEGAAGKPSKKQLKR